jgi:hypothetical protein
MMPHRQQNQRPWGAGDTGGSGDGESSGVTMTAMTSDKTMVRAGHQVVNNNGYWCNADNHVDGRNCQDDKDHDDKLGWGSAAAAVAAEAWQQWWRWQEQRRWGGR